MIQKQNPEAVPVYSNDVLIEFASLRRAEIIATAVNASAVRRKSDGRLMRVILFAVAGESEPHGTSSGDSRVTTYRESLSNGNRIVQHKRGWLEHWAGISEFPCGRTGIS